MNYHKDWLGRTYWTDAKGCRQYVLLVWRHKTGPEKHWLTMVKVWKARLNSFL